MNTALVLLALLASPMQQVVVPPPVYDPIGHPTASDPGPPDARTVELTDIIADLMGGEARSADINHAAARLHAVADWTPKRGYDVLVEARGDVSISHQPVNGKSGQEILRASPRLRIGDDPQKPRPPAHCIFGNRMRTALVARGWREIGDGSFLLVWTRMYSRGPGDGQINIWLDHSGCVGGLDRLWFTAR